MEKIIKICFSLFVVLLLASGIALITISYYPLHEVKEFFDFFTRDGDFVSFSPDHVNKLRHSGMFMCMTGILLFMGRRRVLQYLSIFQPDDFLIRPGNISAMIVRMVSDMKHAVRKDEKVHKYALLLIILIGIALRVYYLSQPLRNDESRVFVMYIYDLTNGVKEMSRLFTTYIMGGHHILNTVLSYLLYKLVGSEQHVWTMRIPAMLAGTLVVPAAYMMVRIFYDKHSALLSAALVATSSPLIFYSTNARGHIMLCLVFLIVLAICSYLKKNIDITGWHLFAILSALGFYIVPIMLYPYGTLLAWLVLSMIFDKGIERSGLMKNMIVSIAVMVFITFIFYSPVIFFGTGFMSLAGLKEVEPQPLSVLWRFVGLIAKVTWASWNKDVHAVLSICMTIGFFVSLVFNKKTGMNRVPVILAAVLWLAAIITAQRVVPYHTRYWLFLLLLYLGTASSGIRYLLLRPLELVSVKHGAAVFAISTVLLTLCLGANKIYSEPYVGRTEEANFDSTGKYIEFEYINAALKYYLQFDHAGKKKVMITFPFKPDNDLWNARLKKYCRDYCDGIIVSDLPAYLSDEAGECHRLYVISSETAGTFEGYLAKNNLPATDYTSPELMHRFDGGNMYKMDRVRDCKE